MNLLSADFRVSIVPASVRQIHAEGVIYVDTADAQAVTKLALALREADRSVKVDNFLAIVRKASTVGVRRSTPAQPK